MKGQRSDERKNITRWFINVVETFLKWKNAPNLEVCNTRKVFIQTFLIRHFNQTSFFFFIILIFSSLISLSEYEFVSAQNIDRAQNEMTSKYNRLCSTDFVIFFPNMLKGHFFLPNKTFFQTSVESKFIIKTYMLILQR